MSKRLKRVSKYLKLILAVLLIAAVVFAAQYIMHSSTAQINEKLFEANALNLTETYKEISSTFVNNAVSRWNYLKAISYLFEEGKDEGLDRLKADMDDFRDKTGYTDFYFVADNGSYITLDGTKGYIDLGNRLFTLVNDKEMIIADGSLPRRDNMMFYAIPVEPNTFNGFAYCALAFGFDKEAMADLFSVTAYNGESNAYITYSNGRVATSATNNQLSLRNVISWLRDSDADEDLTTQVTNDIKNLNTGTHLVVADGRTYYIHYQPLGIHDWMIVSITDADVINQTSQSVQALTSRSLLVVFALLAFTIVAILVAVLISSHRRSNSEIARRDRMFEMMSENMDDAYILLDRSDCGVSYVSPNVRKLFGTEPDKLKHDFWSLRAVMTETLPWEKQDLMSIEPGAALTFDTGINNKETGITKHYRVRVERPAGDKEGSLLAVFTDRTEDEKAQSQIRDALEAAEHANKAKTIFLNNMSHDIRTPMNAIIGFTSLAISHAEDTAAVRDYLGKIAISGDHLLSLINDVLDMSRIESGTVKIEEAECSLPGIIHDLRDLLQANIKAKRQEFFIDTMDVEHEEIIADKLRLNQVLINIAGNAIKYTPAGGTIGIRVTELPNAPEGYADYEFSVKDNGIGMSEEYVKHIFEPFTREQNSTVSGIQGTGLGMAITKNIVDMMNGHIRVSSKLGEGSEFIVSLRFRLGTNRKKVTVIPKLEGCRALIADDSMDSCHSVSRMLKTVGMRAEWTTSGKEAVMRAQYAKEERDPFMVYIIDWLMPDMNGVEVVRRIRREIGDDTPIIILTAYDWTDIENEAREAGVTAFCSKPLFLTELYDVLSNTQTAPAEAETIDPEEFRGRHVLLVDDVELNREIAEAVLEEAGMEVSTATNGREAVDFMENTQPGDIDLILMDVMMPVMDGYEATRTLRKSVKPHVANIPIIAMTANAFEEDKKLAREAGMNDHLAKPFQIEKLYEMMKKYL